MSKITIEKKKLIFETPLNWKVLSGQEGVAVATCDELDMVLQIDDGSPEDQVRQIMEALRLLYDDLEKDDELEQFFAHHGVSVTIQKSIKRSSRKPIHKSQEIQPDLEMSFRTLDIGSSSAKAHV